MRQTTTRRLKGCYLLAALLGGLAEASVESELEVCARIVASAERLACYDALASRSAATPVAPPQAAEVPATAVTPPPPARAASPGPPPAAAVDSPSVIVTADDFGFENQRIIEGLDRIESRYDGEFTGWSGKTLFRLENGQVWKQAQSGRVSHRADRPLVTIERGALGSFRLRVEGLNKTIRVVRIK